MIGAIAGDVIGSVYEFANLRSKVFPLFARDAAFTDDTVLTVAVAEALLDKAGFGEALKRWYARYPNESYGARFRVWAEADEAEPYHSWGNGSAMRVSPVAYAADDLGEVVRLAAASAEPTHNHPEGIKGAQAVATAILLARKGASQEEIGHFCQEHFGYDLSEPLAEIRESYTFDESCQGSVPQALRAFLEAASFEDAIRNAVSIGGDSDTIACIAGAVAEAHFGVPPWIQAEVFRRLDPPLAEVTRAFCERYIRDYHR